MSEPVNNVGQTDPILDRHQQGDPDAFRDLVERYWRPVHNYLYRCGLDRATREDLLQEIFVKIHQNAHTYRPERPLTVWVYTIAANTARSHFRKQTTLRRGAVHVDTAPDELAGSDPSHEEVALANETLGCLAAALAQLPISQREVTVLCCIEGLGQQEVAEILEVPVSTVKTLLRRARFSLARALARHRLRGQREVGE